MHICHLANAINQLCAVAIKKIRTQRILLIFHVIKNESCNIIKQSIKLIITEHAIKMQNNDYLILKALIM